MGAMGASTMQPAGNHTLMRIFVDKFHTVRHRPLHEHLADLAQRQGIAALSVFESLEGFGMRGRLLRDEGAWHLASNREMVVELVDEEARVAAFLVQIEPLLEDAVVTLERARVVAHRHRGKDLP